VNLILDTHSILWFALDDPLLSAKAIAAIEGDENEVYISPASYWEIAIKVCIGKYKLDTPFEDFWNQAIRDGEFEILPIGIPHARAVSQLPLIHRDPFDRMLVAQALCENLTVVGNDSLLDQYGIGRIW
jgi:PIN domain nuclease of toxin-antitoxin system